jgi:hypothetical protein
MVTWELATPAKLNEVRSWRGKTTCPGEFEPSYDKSILTLVQLIFPGEEETKGENTTA